MNTERVFTYFELLSKKKLTENSAFIWKMKNGLLKGNIALVFFFCIYLLVSCYVSHLLFFTTLLLPMAKQFSYAS